MARLDDYTEVTLLMDIPQSRLWYRILHEGRGAYVKASDMNQTTVRLPIVPNGDEIRVQTDGKKLNIMDSPYGDGNVLAQ